jgi:hypothetical protein
LPPMISEATRVISGAIDHPVHKPVLGNAPFLLSTTIPRSRAMYPFIRPCTKRTVSYRVIKKAAKATLIIIRTGRRRVALSYQAPSLTLPYWEKDYLVSRER